MKVLLSPLCLMLMEEDGRRFPKQDANTSRVSRAVTLLNYQTGLYSVVFGITPVIAFFFSVEGVFMCFIVSQIASVALLLCE